MEPAKWQEVETPSRGVEGGAGDSVQPLMASDLTPVGQWGAVESQGYVGSHTCPCYPFHLALIVLVPLL